MTRSKTSLLVGRTVRVNEDIEGMVPNPDYAGRAGQSAEVVSSHVADGHQVLTLQWEDGTLSEWPLNQVLVKYLVAIAPSSQVSLMTPAEFDWHLQRTAAAAMEARDGGKLFGLAMDAAPHMRQGDTNVVTVLIRNTANRCEREDSLVRMFGERANDAITRLRNRGMVTVESGGGTHTPVVVLSPFGCLVARELNLVSLADLADNLPAWLQQTS